MSVVTRVRTLDPLTLGPALWLDGADSSKMYDATTGGSLVAAGGTVARWEDKSGNGRHATQATSSLRPTRQTSILNGRDIVRGNGSQYMSIQSSTAMFNALHSGKGHVFGVIKAGIVADPNTFYGVIGNVGVSQSTRTGFGIYWDDRISTPTNNRLGVSILRNNSDAFCRADNNFQANTFGLFSFHFDHDGAVLSDKLKLSVNGTSAGVAGGTYGSTGQTNSSVDLSIFDFGAGAFLVGDIAEIIIYPYALTSYERQLVEGYLSYKYALPVA